MFLSPKPSSQSLSTCRFPKLPMAMAATCTLSSQRTLEAYPHRLSTAAITCAAAPKIAQRATQRSCTSAAAAFFVLSWHRRFRARYRSRVGSSSSVRMRAGAKPWTWWGVSEKHWPQHSKQLECEAKLIVKEFFGHDALRPDQWKVVQAAIQLEDVSVYWATGAGKSLCYQLFAILAWRHKKAVVVVVEPVIALMIDQVQHFNSAAGAHNGPSACLLGTAQFDETVEKAALGGHDYALVYVTPENFTEHLLAGFQTLYENDRLALFAVDEAAYIHLWGHHFRPSFQNMWFARVEYPSVPFMTLSGAAPPSLQTFIERQLQLREPFKSTGPMLRRNLHLSFRRKHTEEKDLDRIAKLVSKPGSSSIVYVVLKARARRVARELQRRLESCCFRVEMLTGDTPANQRAELNQAFQQNEIQVMVATAAYGMGIDKPGIDNIINYGPPINMEDYYNQIGRAGRDGRPAACTLYFSDDDWKLFRKASTFQHDLKEMHKEDRKLEVDSREKLHRLATCNCCRWQPILEHFGRKMEAAAEGCGVCDVCRNEQEPCTERLQTFTCPGQLLLKAVEVATMADAAPSKEEVLQVALESSADVANLEEFRANLERHELSKAFLAAVLDALYGHGFVHQEYLPADSFNDDAFFFRLSEAGKEAMRTRQSIQLVPPPELRNLALPAPLRSNPSNAPIRSLKRQILQAVEELEAIDDDDVEAKSGAAHRVQELTQLLGGVVDSQTDTEFAPLLKTLSICFGRPASMRDLNVYYAQKTTEFYSCTLIVPSLGSERFTGVSLRKPEASKLAVRNAVAYLGHKQRPDTDSQRAVRKLHDMYRNKGLEIKTTFDANCTFLSEIVLHALGCKTFEGLASRQLHRTRDSSIFRACAPPGKSLKGSYGKLNTLLGILTPILGRKASRMDVRFVCLDNQDKLNRFKLYVPALNRSFEGKPHRKRSDARRACLAEAITSLSGRRRRAGNADWLRFLTASLGRTATEDDFETSYVQLPDKTYTCTLRVPALANLQICGTPHVVKGFAKLNALREAPPHRGSSVQSM
eukprot:TRINITY_DN15997_c0_g4_i1.p1 TRINITY_DN15997_c0_g4~~TRINITY_DN15997_c0_g4_i1.p1  ORF type:complete len:1041 (-),score=135.72 TRINITY_DN15997_c0_g4_i1:265-3387(-)